MSHPNLKRSARRQPSWARRHLTGALCALSLLGAFSLASQAVAQDQPKAVADTLIHDFGVIPRGDLAAHTFVLRNEGDAPLVIAQVRASCACTVVDHPNVIAAGESGEIRIDLDTMLLTGPTSKRVMLYTNDPDSPRIDLTIKVDARPYIDVLPGYFRYIVVQGFGDEGEIKQVVMASSPAEFSVVKVEVPVDFIDIEFHEAEPSERYKDHNGPQWIVAAKIRPDAPVGPLTGYIDIYTDHAKQKKASIPLSGFVRPVFAVTPIEADFGELELEEPLLSTLDVRSFATEEIAITGVENSVEGIETSIEAQTEGRRYWLKLKIPADMPKGPFNGIVTMTTDSERAPEIKVNIRGTVL